MHYCTVLLIPKSIISLFNKSISDFLRGPYTHLKVIKSIFQID